MAWRNTDGQPVTGTYDTPTVPNIQLLALLWPAAAQESRMVIDTMTNVVYLVVPRDYDMMRCMPPGTQQFQCALAPSCHLMLPCAEFPSGQERRSSISLELVQQLSLQVTRNDNAATTPIGNGSPQ